MLIESSVPLLVRCLYEVVHLAPGIPVELTEADALRLLAKAPGQVRAIEPPKPNTPHAPDEGADEEVIDLAPPVAPLQPFWAVTYRDADGRLRGGSDDKAHGTVKACRWQGNNWTVELTDGQRLDLWRIRAVGRTDSLGQIVSAWTVREHGLDGSQGAAAK